MLFLAFFLPRYVLVYIMFLEIIRKESNSVSGIIGFNSCEWIHWPMTTDKIRNEGCNESKIKTKDLYQSVCPPHEDRCLVNTLISFDC